MDYDPLRLEEMAAISDFLHELRPEQWDQPSLCDGWRVRDVVSHMCVGYITPMPSMVVKVARRGFNVPKALVGAKKRVAGLRLVAADVGWSAGDGPDVTGPGEAILLAASGRPIGLDGLSGEGLDALRIRMVA